MTHGLGRDGWPSDETVIKTRDGEIESLRQQLAECQATNGKLIKEYYGLPQRIAEFCFGSKDEVGNCSMAAAFLSVAHCLSAKDGLPPLAITNDATALNELIAERTASLTAEVEYWKNIRTENAVYFEKREAELTTHRDILTHELNYARARFNKAIRVLSGIHSLLYPPHFTDKDGKVWAFKSPIVEEQIQALSDKIRAIPDDISAIDAAIANCKEQK